MTDLTKLTNEELNQLIVAALTEEIFRCNVESHRLTQEEEETTIDFSKFGVDRDTIKMIVSQYFGDVERSILIRQSA